MFRQFFGKSAAAKKGFTLIEILIVIGIIAILAAIVIIAINPAKQFAQARNTQRESGVNTILNAIGQNVADNKGVLTGCTGDITSSEKEIASSGGVDLAECLVPTYIPTQLPVDPSSPGEWNDDDDYDTGYKISVDAGRYTVCAPNHHETNVPGSEEFCLTR
jgi:type IV pilus assembly protein PilA